MSQLNTEYTGTITNPRPGYSNLYCYGANGMSRPIIPPTPATVQPEAFNYLRPHKLPNYFKVKAGHMENNESDNCTPYRTLEGTCRKCWSK